MKYTGRLIVMRAFCVGTRIDLSRLTLPTIYRTVRLKHARKILAPRYANPFPALEVYKPIVTVQYEGARIPVTVHIKVYEAGTIVVEAHVLFRDLNGDELIRLSRLEFAEITVKGASMTFEQWLVEQFEEFYAYIKDAVEAKYPLPDQPLKEDYTYIIITKTVPKRKPQFFLSRKRAFLAGLILGWPGWRDISKQETDDALNAVVTYTKQDATIIGWSRGILITPAEDLASSVLATINFANVQRLHLRYFMYVLTKARMHMKGGKLFGLLKALLPPTRSPLPKLIDVKTDITFLEQGLKLASLWAEESFLGRCYAMAHKKLQLDELEAAVQTTLEAVSHDISVAAELRTAYWLELFVVLILVVWLLLEFL